MSSTSTAVPSFRRRLLIRCARPFASASRVMSRPSSRMSSPKTRSSIWRPTASSAVCPNSSAAAGFQPVTRSSASMTTTATGLISTSDSKCSRCRSTSANRRAFWIAPPTFEAIVSSRRASASTKRPSSRMLCTLITPIARSPAKIGTPRYDIDGVPTRVLALVVLLPVEQERLARLEDLRREPLSVPDRMLGRSLAALVVVDEVDLPGGLVEQRDVGDVGLEGLADALADELDQGVELELCRERLADAVHGGQLGHALARLVDEPRVVERDAEAAGQRRQEPLVVLVEGVRAVEVLEGDDARGPPADDERDEQRGLARLAAQHVRVAVPIERLPAVLSSISSGSRVSIDVLAEADQRHRLRRRGARRARSRRGS